MSLKERRAAIREIRQRQRGKVSMSLEAFIVHKIVRGTREEVCGVVHMLAYMDYDEGMLKEESKKYLATGMLFNAIDSARKLNRLFKGR